ncbi:MAG: dTDP-4-dehydrorhamnose reductase [Methylotenera sp.]|nr:MAG: dTDP-4-dehydrorhamnose reductase [Methylotenera sp.]
MYQKILLTGINGQVGHSLQVALQASQFPTELIALDRTQLDLANAEQIREVVRTIQPDLIINPAAYTAVDKAESEYDLAYSINAIAPGILAEEAARLNAKLIHFSTDYVYNGRKLEAYQEDDATQPLSVYGKTKLAGEEAIRPVGIPHLIFRTAWVYGAYGKNFMKTILRLASEQETLYIVADQMGTPTSSNAIAEAMMQILQQGDFKVSGVYHLVNSGQASWFEFAQAIVEESNMLRQREGKTGLLVKHIQPISTDQYPTPARRPANSLLDTGKLLQDFDIEMPHWRESLIKELSSLHASNL